MLLEAKNSHIRGSERGRGSFIVWNVKAAYPPRELLEHRGSFVGTFWVGHSSTFLTAAVGGGGGDEDEVDEGQRKSPNAPDLFDASFKDGALIM